MRRPLDVSTARDKANLANSHTVIHLLPHCHTPTSIQVISLDHFHYYLVTMLAFPIRVSGEIKDEPWGSDDDKSEPPRSSSKFRTSSRKPRWINRKRVSASGNFVVIHANILGCFSYASCILA